MPLKRWSSSQHREVVSPKIDAFLIEISQVCIRHNLSISHEDRYGAFVIEPFDAKLLEWLIKAHDETAKAATK